MTGRCSRCDLVNGCPEFCRCRPQALIDRLNDEADLCHNEGAADIAQLLDEAARELRLWADALRKACGDDGALVRAYVESQEGGG